MSTEVLFSTSDLPPLIGCQILSFVRIEWPKGFVGDRRFRSWIHLPQYHPQHLVLIEGDILISHVGILWRHLPYRGQIYKLYGLGHVFTYPVFRGEGFAKKLVQSATHRISRSDAEIALLTCKPELRRFYEQAGWCHMSAMKLFEGPIDRARPARELPMMLFRDGEHSKERFREGQVFFDGELW